MLNEIRNDFFWVTFIIIFPTLDSKTLRDDIKMN